MATTGSGAKSFVRGRDRRDGGLAFRWRLAAEDFEATAEGFAEPLVGFVVTTGEFSNIGGGIGKRSLELGSAGKRCLRQFGSRRAEFEGGPEVRVEVREIGVEMFVESLKPYQEALDQAGGSIGFAIERETGTDKEDDIAVEDEAGETVEAV